METENEKNASIGSFTRDAEDSENYISDNSKSSPFFPRKAKTRKKRNDIVRIRIKISFLLLEEKDTVVKSVKSSFQT